MSHRVLVAVTALLVVIVSACATVSPAHRGASMPDIHAVISKVLTKDGYTCEPSPDRSSFACTHPEVTDVSFAYLPQSNLVQIWAVFSRADEALDARWRSEDCDVVHKDVNAVNDEVIIKFVCTPKSLRFEMVTWVPDGGLNADDVQGFVGVFRAVIGEVIRDRMLPATAPAGGEPAAVGTDI
jgi:hypothetical protein